LPVRTSTVVKHARQNWEKVLARSKVILFRPDHHKGLALFAALRPVIGNGVGADGSTFPSSDPNAMNRRLTFYDRILLRTDECNVLRPDPAFCSANS